MAGLGLGIVALVVLVLYREPLTRWFRKARRLGRPIEPPQWSRRLPNTYRHVRVHTDEREPSGKQQTE